MGLQPADRLERRLGAAAHLLPLLGLVFPGGNMLAPLLMYLAFKPKSVFVRNHAAESFNFQVTVTLGMVALWALVILLLIVRAGFLYQWAVEWYQHPSTFTWPEWSEVGTYALLALAGIVISLILFVVLWIWNLFEIGKSCINAWNGKVSKYTFIFRPLMVVWDKGPPTGGRPLIGDS
jgi:uncharacterized Tic20 family protein